MAISSAEPEKIARELKRIADALEKIAKQGINVRIAK